MLLRQFKRIYRLRTMAGHDTAVVKLVQSTRYTAALTDSSPMSIVGVCGKSFRTDVMVVFRFPEELPEFLNEEALLSGQPSLIRGIVVSHANLSCC